MPDVPVTVSLTAAGVAPTVATGMLRHYTPGARLGRAARIMGIALLLAISLFPIPIIHLIGPPALLLFGGITAFRQLRATARLAPMRILCPKCASVNRVGGGLGVRDATLPVTRLCESCRRVLTLQVGAPGSDAGSPPSR